MVKVVIFHIIVVIVCLLYVLLFWILSDNIQDIRREILAEKALSSNKHMLKYVQKMVRTAYHQAIFHRKWDSESLLHTNYDIEVFCNELFKQSNDWTWQDYQSRCIDMIDNAKTTIKNYYQDGCYKYMSECMLTYLSFCEVNILSHNIEDWDKLDDIDPWDALSLGNKLFQFHKFFDNFLLIMPYTEKDENSFTPQEMVATLRKQNTNVPQTEEWYQELQDDLEFLQKYYRNCLFQMDGSILLPEEIYYSEVFS